MGESNMERVIPRGRKPFGRRAKALRSLLLACGLLVAVPLGLRAQNGDKIHYVNFPDFNIPFRNIDDPRVTDVILYVSTDGKEYFHVQSAKPADRRFHFQSRGDGLYYFVVQTRDRDGTLSPANPNTATPNTRIYVDTRAPVIEELTADPAAKGLPAISWKINEPNLKEIRADYRPLSGGDWVPILPFPAQQEGKRSWKPAWGGELEVRMQACDQAGNLSEPKTLRLRAADGVAHMAPPSDNATGPGKVMYVKSKTFQLQYEIDTESKGPSGVASVDIWMLHQGQGWKKYTDKATPKGPATVTVDAAGRWGFRLIPRSGVGLAERNPRPGDSPDIWVEVDDKPPQVRVSNVTVTQEQDGGYLTVYWKADDTFLQATPITIYLSTTPQGGDVQPIASKLANRGSYRIKTDDPHLGGRYEFYIKVEAIDEAGNIGSDQWRNIVKVDLKIPRIKSINVQPSVAPEGGRPETPRPPPTETGDYSGRGLPNMQGAPVGGTRNPRPPSTTTGTNGGFANPSQTPISFPGAGKP
jgi:hypothetical protein